MLNEVVWDIDVGVRLAVPRLGVSVLDPVEVPTVEGEGLRLFDQENDTVMCEEMECDADALRLAVPSQDAEGLCVGVQVRGLCVELGEGVRVRLEEIVSSNVHEGDPVGGDKVRVGLRVG